MNNKELYALALDGAFARLAKINAAITELRTFMSGVESPGAVTVAAHLVSGDGTGAGKKRKAKKRRGGMTDEGRARIAEAQRKRWAKIRKEQANAEKAQGKTKAAVAKKRK